MCKASANTYLHDILLDDFRIVANRFDEEQLKSHFLNNDIMNHYSSVDRGISSVEYRDFAIAALEPLAYIVQRIHRTLRSDRHCLNIVGSKEIVTLVRSSRVPSVLTEIEHFRVYTNPVEITTQFLRYVRFTPSGETDHRDHMRLVDKIRSFP